MPLINQIDASASKVGRSIGKDPEMNFTGYEIVGSEVNERLGISFSSVTKADGSTVILISGRGGAAYYIKESDLPDLDRADGAVDGQIHLDNFASLSESYKIIASGQINNFLAAGDVDADGLQDYFIRSSDTYLISGASPNAADVADGAQDRVINVDNIRSVTNSYQFEQTGGRENHINYVGDVDGDVESSGVEDELTFIRSAFSSDEISVDDNQVTYTLQLPVDDDSDDVKIDVSVILPAGYPSVGINGIKVVMNEKSTCCPEIRKIALDALPTVHNICSMEARALEGSASLSSIFSVADMWAKDDWYGVMAKQLSLSKGKGKSSKTKSGEGSFEICTFLIYTHHIVDPDKIQLVKKGASKLHLCGYMKIGRPGLILVEGPQSDCEALLETLLLTRKKRRESHGGKVDSATFMAAGNVVRKAKTSSERALPKKLEQLESKDGMDTIKDACEKAGLLGSLEEVCKR